MVVRMYIQRFFYTSYNYIVPINLMISTQRFIHIEFRWELLLSQWHVDLVATKDYLNRFVFADKLQVHHRNYNNTSLSYTYTWLIKGTWTAIWSPSKSALKPLQTNGCKQIARSSTKMGWKACMPNLGRVGALFNNIGCPRITSLSISHTIGYFSRIWLLAIPC